MAALDICGPFNMQFIVKDDQVKVIECNLRVSRTFPFVSKTLNINLIEIAMDVMLGRNRLKEVRPDPHAVGVKVAKFSFSRLKKADFSLGVEMVSTGEVACYGRDRYDAYLKAIQASDFCLPKEGGGVVVSLGTYKFKEEFIESCRMLKNMGYRLLGTRGTSDFMNSHDIGMEELVFDGGEDPRYWDSLVANGEIDLVINASRKGRVLPEGEKISKGYIIRRTAVDNSIPLIADVKCAKLFVKSLELFHQNGRRVWTDTQVDCMTSYDTVRIPGLVDVHVHMREPGGEHKEDWTTGTSAALAGGIVALCAMPNTDPSIVGEEELALVQKLASQKAVCDFGLFVGAGADNTDSVSKLVNHGAIALKMYLNNTYGPLLLENISTWGEHIKNWPCDDRPLCVHAEGQTLSAVLHIANMHNKRIHVCHVSGRAEIELIKMSKEAGMKVTCEVAPHHLFMTHEDLHRLGSCGGVKPPLMAEDDKKALWEHMDIIDCFATDHAPHTMEEKRGEKGPVPPGFPGMETALPLLLTAVSEGRLTLDQIVEKYHTNPIKIFHLEGLVGGIDDGTYVEVDLDRKWIIGERKQFTKSQWTPFEGMQVTGMVRRVVLRGKVVYVDGEILAEPGYGIDLGRLSLKNKKLVESSEEDLTNSRGVVLDEAEEIGLVSMLRGVRESWRGRSLFSVEELTRQDLRLLFDRAEQIRAMPSVEIGQLLSGKMIGMIFYEPSTRTKCSFSAACQRLGGKIVETEVETSSVKKGESFPDFVRCIQSYTDAIVIRSSPAVDLMGLNGMEGINVPIVNAGDGCHEHPTQALLDIYTIRREIGTVNNYLKIALVGDLKHGRTVHSLAKLLSVYRVELKCVSPAKFGMPIEIIEWVRNRGVTQTIHESLDEVIEDVDVLYLTRIQRERMEDGDEEFKYQVTPKSLAKAKPELVIMHPLPRVDEISTEIDTDPRAAYFRQMENGMWVRMALIDLILGN